MNIMRLEKKAVIPLLWKGQKLNVTVTPKMVQVTSETQKEPIDLKIWGYEYSFKEELIVIKKDTVQ